ncbi:MAG: TonB-dependent receptor [Ignavibacteriaceae bacterium]|nr:TonB-dependent receptor [Ignavibacteriaceae bacterium]
MTRILQFLLAFSVLIFSAEKGSIQGQIQDAKTKEALPGVNIIAKGTYYGAATDFNGKFKIENVTAGTYTIEVSLIGYKTTQYTGIKVVEGKPTILDVLLEETVLTLDQDIVVVGDKPLINIEETQSKKSVSREDIELSIVENVSDIVVQQAGVVKSDNSIHIRGGRSYENAFMLDGVSVQDPLAGTGFGLQLSANSIEEVEIITGGFNAEFGQATSGIVNVRTREGSITKYAGSVTYKKDNFGDRTSPHVFNIDIVEANLSGPEPFTNFILPGIGINVPGELSFFVNGYAGLSDGITQGYYKPKSRIIYSSIFSGDKFAFRAENSWFALGKLTYKWSPTFKIGYSYNQSVSINQNSQSLQSNLEYVEPSPGYQYEFQNILEDANTFTHNNKYNTLTLTHTLNSRTFYEIKLGHFFTHLRADANGKHWSEYTEPKDIPSFPVEYYNPDRDTIGIIPGDGFWDVGNPSTWRDHHVEEFSLKGDITSFFDEKNKFKAGFNIQFQEMQVVDIFRPWVGELGLNNDIYKVYPTIGSMYAQDNINFGGMILNFGLRYDFWFPGKFVDDAVDNPEVITIPDEIRTKYKEESFNLFGNRHYKGRLSPRLGISHPISEFQTLFFSYGHFSKWPRPQFVYAKLSPYSAKSSFQRFGNPNLKPETTVAYELGLKTQISDDDVLTATAYYKDIFDYVNTRTSLISSARFATQRFITYVNQDYARSRGLELEYKKRIGKWFTGAANFSYSIVTGKASSADDGVLVLSGLLEESIKEEYVGWDRPFTGSLNTSFYIERDKALFGFGNGYFDDITVLIRMFYQSGKRYTPAVFSGSYAQDGRPEYEFIRNSRYNKIGDDWFWVDLNLEKNIAFGGMRFILFVEVSNLFDHQNSAIINPVTGRAYEIGDATPNSWNDPLYPDLQAPLNPYPFNPARYLTRRNIKFGVTVRF